MSPGSEERAGQRQDLPCPQDWRFPSKIHPESQGLSLPRTPRICQVDGDVNLSALGILGHFVFYAAEMPLEPKDGQVQEIAVEDFSFQQWQGRPKVVFQELWRVHEERQLSEYVLPSLLEMDPYSHLIALVIGLDLRNRLHVQVALSTVGPLQLLVRRFQCRVADDFSRSDRKDLQ